MVSHNRKERHMWIAMFLLSTLAPAAPRLDLEGAVQDEAGKPVADAVVFIHTAGPRKGRSSICPSCYLDCWRRTQTSADGRFVFEKVDGSLVFRVGAVTPVHEAAFVSKVDPLEAGARLTLRPRAPVPDAPRRVLRGRVLDLDGRPVPQAVVEPKGWVIRSGDTTTSTFGNPRNMPALTISGDDGRFLLMSGQEVDGLVLEVSARGLASVSFDDVPVGLEERPLTLGPGCSLRGRVLRGGEPLAGITVGAVQKDRSAGTFVGERTAVTNAEGRFILPSLVADSALIFYSKMQDAPQSVPWREVKTTGHDTVVDLGDLAVAAGARLIGRVVLPEGRALPPDATLSVHRTEAWDFVVVPVGEGGRFTVEGLPPEPVRILAGIAGHRLSPENELPIKQGGLWLAPLEGDREITVRVEAATREP
jgi:hypothetical protein